jgi:hypothetical protein
MGTVILPEGDADLGDGGIENVTQVATENVVRVEKDAKVGTQKGASEDIVPGAKTQKIKGTATFVLDFDESNDEVHDEDAEHDRGSRLSESTINVNTGERVSYELEKGVSTGNFTLLLHVIFFLFLYSFDLCFCLCRGIFSTLSHKEKTIDIGKMKDVAQEPATSAEVLEAAPAKFDLEAYKRCLEYCQAQGVNLDTFKFVGIGLDKLCIMPKKLELKLSRFIDNAFAVPDAEAELAGKSSLELADASVSLMYKVSYF